MKKKLMCVLLAAMMLMSPILFAACASNNEDDPDPVNPGEIKGTATINMAIQVSDDTDPDSVKAVEAALNRITKSKFKTKVNLLAFKESEYYDALEQSFRAKEEDEAEKKKVGDALKKYKKDNKDKMNAAEAEKKFYEEYPEYAKYAETTVDPDAATTAEETYYNADTGLLELKYPETDPNVIDVFFVGGYDRLLEYIENEWVVRLDDELSSGAKKLKYYISTSLLNSVKVDNATATYAIPNNRTIGEYTYMLVNKELMNKYYYSISDLRDLISCEAFLEDIATFEPNVIPINGTPELYNVFFWSIDPDTLKIDTNKFSVIGTTYTASSSFGIQLHFTSIISSKKPYRDQLLYNKLYEELGYFKTDVPANATCAIKIVKGGAELEKVYGEEYEMVVLESPRASQEMVFESMFAVGGYTKDVTRSMEIITYLNTNSEMRNILAYGVEDVNYTLDTNGQVVRTADNGYWTDINKTGNTFIAYTEQGSDPELWEYGMKQNRESTIDLILGFSFAGEKVNVEAIKKMQDISDQVQARIDACATFEELKDLLATLTTEFKINADILNYVKSNNDDSSMPYAIFHSWLDRMGFIPKD